MWVQFFGGKNFSNQIPIPFFAWFAGWRTPDLMRTQEKIEHVALSRLPGRWGSLDFNKKVLLFLLRLLLRIRAASPRFLPPTCRHHGHQYSPRPRSKCQLKWRNTRARRLYLQLSGAHAPEHSCEHSTGCGHMRIRTLSRAPGHAGHIWTRTCTRKKARIDAK